MRLQSIGLHNFKAFESVTLELAPLTVLIGLNNAGKSSVLHALALAAQSVGGDWETQGRLVDLGPDQVELIHRVAAGRANVAQIHLTWQPEESSSPIEKVGLMMQIEKGPTPYTIFEAAVGVSEETGRTVFSSPWGETFLASGPVGEHTVPQDREPWRMRIDTRNLPDDLRWPLATAAPFFESFVLDSLPKYRYVSASRHVDSSVYPLGERASANPRTAQELIDTLAYDDELLERVSTRCGEMFGYGLAKDLVENRRIALQAVGAQGRLNVVNVGAGLVQMVWVLTLLELAHGEEQELPPPWTFRLVGLEEPELHLHPALQTNVALALAEFTRDDVGIICTTQSEHLLMSLLSLVLEGRLRAPDLAVYYVESGSAERLEVDDRGRISGGLRGFFEANEAQLQHHIDLLRRRG